MDFKEWLLFKAKNAGDRSDLMHRMGNEFVSSVEAGREAAYKEVAECRYMDDFAIKSIARVTG